MARYHVDNRFTGTTQNITSTYKSIVHVRAQSPSPRRGRVVAISMGADTNAYNATDCQVVYTCQRITVDGTGTAATPNPIVPGDSVTLSLSQVNTTAEGTYTLPIFTRVLNQRASMQWTFPDVDAMLQWPATAGGATSGNGVVGLALSPTLTTPVNIGFDYEDL